MFYFIPPLDYCLAVLCSSEMEDKCRMVTALERYRVSTPITPSIGEIQNYVKRQLSGGAANAGKRPASDLDTEKLVHFLSNISRSILKLTTYHQNN